MTLMISLPPDDETKLSQRAAAAGKDVTEYVQQLIRRDLAGPAGQNIDEVLAPLRKAFAESGVSDEELLSDINAARDECRDDLKKRTA